MRWATSCAGRAFWSRTPSAAPAGADRILEATASVALAEQRSASAVLHSVLENTCVAFPDALGGAAWPSDSRAFRKTYPEALVRFEAARLASPARVEIARHAVQTLQSHLVWQAPDGARPLRDVLSEPTAPLNLQSQVFAGEPGWRPHLIDRGTRWHGAQLAELAGVLVGRGMANHAAGAALTRVAEHVVQNGAVSLAGRKIAVLGAGAEMAPTRFWLQAGADVLWLDTVPPPTGWFDAEDLRGRLVWPEGNVDLLARPQEVLATLIAFAEGHPLDLGLYAYAPGHARELRLTATMNALVNALPEGLAGSVTLLVSPTTPTGLQPEELETMRTRRQNRPAWQTTLAGLGLLGRGDGCVKTADAAVSRTAVSIQGASYQAAQYLGKVLIADCWAGHGTPDASTPRPLRVSANTAAVTRTRSLQHPVFAAAFNGAAAFGVETFAPRLSRRLNGLLTLGDWLHPDHPKPGQVRVHGGIHTLPYPLEPALRVAAAIGFARSPRLLRGLLARQHL